MRVLGAEVPDGRLPKVWIFGPRMQRAGMQSWLSAMTWPSGVARCRMLPGPSRSRSGTAPRPRREVMMSVSGSIWAGLIP